MLKRGKEKGIMQNAATSKPKKKGLKTPHLLVLILSLLVLMSLRTYIIPAGQFGTDPETGAILSAQHHCHAVCTAVCQAGCQRLQKLCDGPR